MTVDNKKFREALGCFTTGVAVVTTVTENNPPIGLTINSFSSVSLDPPLVLWSLRKASNTREIFENSPCFTVNILADCQEEISNCFAKSNNDGFQHITHTIGFNDCPILDGSLAHFECEVFQTVDGGDHTIFIGLVKEFVEKSGSPLLFHRGSYGKLQMAESA